MRIFMSSGDLMRQRRSAAGILRAKCSVRIYAAGRRQPPRRFVRGSPMTRLLLSLCLLTTMIATPASQTPRPRARDLGLAPGVFPPGPLNAITDVAGVRVGHRTIVEGDRIRTGVTVILPHGGNIFDEKVPGAVFVGNAFG